MREYSFVIGLKRLSRRSFTTGIKGGRVNFPGVGYALSSGLSLEKQLLVCFARMSLLMIGGNSPYLLKVDRKSWSEPDSIHLIFKYSASYTHMSMVI